MSDAFRTHDGRTLQQAAFDLVQREVLCCMSSMISTLIGNDGGFGCMQSSPGSKALAGLCDQAAELSAPVLDYEEAAREAGWKLGTLSGNVWEDGETEHRFKGTAEQLCAAHDIEPHEWEVYEHWAVSTWLAEKLQAAGERVDTDFAGLNVWARTTTGQAISIDSVIERITRDMHAAR